MNENSMVWNLLGHEFTITEAMDMPDDLSGDSDLSTRTIRINGRMQRPVKVESLYHEVTHALLDLGGFSTFMDEKMEEALTQYLGMALAQVLSANRDLLSFLKEEEENE